MFENLLRSVFGSKHERDLKRVRPLVDEINRLADQYQALPDEALQAKTLEFKARLAEGETLDDLLPEAFAAVKDTCRRLLGRGWEVGGVPLFWSAGPTGSAGIPGEI